MLIKIEQFLERMDRWEKEGIPASELGLCGTFAVMYGKQLFVKLT